MKGRGVRVIDARELQAATPDARAKTHFVIVDCVEVSDVPLADTQPLERKKTVSFKLLLERVAMGGTDPAMLSSLASRLARLDRQCGPEERERIAEASGGAGVGAISHAIVEGLDPDRQVAKARSMFDVPADDEPTERQVQQAATTLLKQAAEPIASRPALRHLLQDIKRRLEQLIDDISVDELIEAGASEEAKQKAKSLVDSFERFIADNKDEIDALQCFYGTPYAKRLRFSDLKTLADELKAPPPGPGRPTSSGAPTRRWTRAGSGARRRSGCSPTLSPSCASRWIGTPSWRRSANTSGNASTSGSHSSALRGGTSRPSRSGGST